MTPSVSDLYDAALALPECERAELTAMLQASLTTRTETLHPEWSEEIRNRAEEVDSGKVHPIAWEDIQRSIQARLNSCTPNDG